MCAYSYIRARVCVVEEKGLYLRHRELEELAPRFLHFPWGS